MAPSSVSVAVIGAGMAGRAHANAWRQASTVFNMNVPEVDLAMIADEYLPFAADSARRYGYQHAVADWRAVAEDPGIDVVSIAVRNDLHVEIARELAAAGKHVLCEKPLAGSLEDAAAMAELEVRYPGLVFGVGFTFRRNPSIAQLAKLVAEGRIGALCHVDGRYWCDYGADAEAPIAWRYRGPDGSGALGDLGSHLIDTAERIGGEIVSVRGALLATYIQQRPEPSGVAAGGRDVAPSAGSELKVVENEDVAAFTARFANGATGTFSCSRVAVGHPNELAFSINGTGGSLGWDLSRAGEIHIADSAGEAGLRGPRQVLAGPNFPYFANGSSMPFVGVGVNQIDQFTYQAFAFLQQVAGTDDPEFERCASFGDGYRGMRLTDAVVRSAQQGGVEMEVA